MEQVRVCKMCDGEVLTWRLNVAIDGYLHYCHIVNQSFMGPMWRNLCYKQYMMVGLDREHISFFIQQNDELYLSYPHVDGDSHDSIYIPHYVLPVIKFKVDHRYDNALTIDFCICDLLELIDIIQEMTLEEELKKDRLVERMRPPDGNLVSLLWRSAAARPHNPSPAALREV